MNTTPTIAIIGAGFSGTITLAQLVRQAKHPIHILFIAHSHPFARGVAYSTTDPLHMLNVRACHMSALEEDQDSFFSWLMENTDRWRSLHPTYKNWPPIDPEEYYPRMVYGLYLDDLLQQTKALAAKKQIHIDLIQEPVIDVDITPENTFKIAFKHASEQNANFLVLAMSVPPMKHLPFETPALLNDDRYIFNVWNPDLTSHTLAGDILILGTGLTMVDVVTTLSQQQHKGSILALSPNGILSSTHLEKSSQLPHKIHITGNTILEMFRQFRQLLSDAQQQGFDWRAVVDALRPTSSILWHRLSLKDKKQFLRHLFSLWNRHRHRLSPFSGSMIHYQLQEGLLRLRAGVVHKVDTSDPNTLTVHLRFADEPRDSILPVHHLINCCGPELRLSKREHSLLHKLQRKGLIEPDPLDLGIALDEAGFVKGKASGKIFTLGALLFGEHFETTAAPEIRAQAYTIAKKLIHQAEEYI